MPRSRVAGILHAAGSGRPQADQDELDVLGLAQHAGALIERVHLARAARAHLFLEASDEPQGLSELLPLPPPGEVRAERDALLTPRERADELLPQGEGLRRDRTGVDAERDQAA